MGKEDDRQVTGLWYYLEDFFLKKKQQQKNLEIVFENQPQ